MCQIRIGNKYTAKAYSSFRRLSDRRARHYTYRIPGDFFAIAAHHRLLSGLSDPDLGCSCRHLDNRRRLATLQQRGPTQAGINIGPSLLIDFNEHPGTNPRPHRRIPRIHVQVLVNTRQ